MKNLRSPRALSFAGVALVLTIAGIVLWFQRPDSGVEACEKMASGRASMTAIRPLFAESRHGDLRDHGEKMIKAAEAYGNPDAKSDGSDQRDTELKNERQAVQAACADHGVTVELA